MNPNYVLTSYKNKISTISPAKRHLQISLKQHWKPPHVYTKFLKYATNCRFNFVLVQTIILNVAIIVDHVEIYCFNAVIITYRFDRRIELFRLPIEHVRIVGGVQNIIIIINTFQIRYWMKRFSFDGELVLEL